MRKAAYLWVISVFVLGVVSFLSGCDNLPFPKKAKAPATAPIKAVVEVEGTILAKINNEVITLEDFNKRLDNINKAYPDVKIEKFDDKKAFLSELIKRELRYQKALEKDLGKKQEVVDAIEDFEKEVLSAQLIEEQTTHITVEAKEIEDYYNTFKDEFTSPEERKLREIIVSTEEKAKELLIELLKGQDFKALAITNSISPSGKDAGDLGFVKKGERQGRFNDVVFSLAVGEISNVFKVPEGYAIVKVEEKKGGESRSLSEVWGDIETGLLRLKQYQQLLKVDDELRMAANLEIHEDLLR